MRLLYLAAADSIHAYRWIKYLAERGHQIYWISLTPLTAGDPIPNVRLQVIPQWHSKATGVVVATFAARRRLMSEQFDIVHSHYAGTYGLIGALSTKKNLAVTAWGSDVLLSRHSVVKRPLLKFILQRASVITCDADHMVEAMVQLGIDRKKIHIILFGTDTNRFKPFGKDPKILDQWGARTEQIIISLRSLYPIYDIPTLVKAVPIIVQRVPNIKVIIVGPGPERQALEQLVQESNVAKQVCFCGAVKNTMLPLLLSSADVYVSTSLSDAGLAASTAEAMSCGVPVVITDSGENHKWVEDGVQGFVVKVRDFTALANKIIWLLEHPTEAKTMGLNGREAIDTRNSYLREMAKVERLYEDLVIKAD